MFLATVLSSQNSQAAVGINNQISFQGKVVKSDNTNPTDGTYNMEFKIYSGGSSTGGGTLVWTEERLISASNGVTVNSGTFQVNLGAVNSLSGVDFTNDTLWLSMQIGNTSNCSVTTTFQANCGGDGEMSPYIRFTSTPYAITAGSLVGTNGANSTKLSFVAPTSTGQSILIPDASGTLCLQNSTSCGFAASTGAAGYIQNTTTQQANSNFNISGDGTLGGTLTATSGSFSGNLVASGDFSNVNRTTHNLTRTLPTTTNNTVDIGTVTLGNGNANFTFEMTSPSGCFAISKIYNFSVGYNATGGAWQRILASSDSGAFCGNDFALEVNAGTANSQFRIRRLSGTDAGTVNITMIRQSQQADSFTPSTTVTTGAAVVTAILNSTALLQVGGNVGIGTFAPGAKLDVVGNERITADSTTALLVQTTGSVPYLTVDTTNSMVEIGSQTTDAVAIELVLDRYNSATEPTVVAGAMYYNTALGRFRCAEGSIWVNCTGATFSSANIANSSAISNTTTATAFSLSSAMPASYCTQGRAVRVMASGVFSTTTTAPTLSFSVRLNGTVLGNASAATTTVASATNQGWGLDYTFICNSAIGTTAAVNGQGYARVATSTNGSTSAIAALANSATSSVNTTATQTITVGAQWGTANTANTITLNQLVISAN